MSLRHRAATAAFAVLLAFAAKQPAHAADLYGAEVYPPPAASPYDDPRYGDIYRHPPPQRFAAPQPELYRPRYGEPPIRDRDGYLREMPRPDARDGRYGAGAACLPHEVVREQLERRGWSGFHDLEMRGNVAHLKARRVNGRWFDLTVDRCTGRVLESRLAEHRAADADDYRPAPGYGEPPGYQAPGYQPPPAYQRQPGYPPQRDYGYQGAPGY